MVKHVVGWDITKKRGSKRKICVRQFSWSKVDCMKDYRKHCIRENNPYHLIFHVATKDGPSNKKAKCIVESIICLTKEVTASNLDVPISTFIPSKNNWNNKVMEVDSYFKSDSHPPKKIVSFALMKAIGKWWNMLFTSSWKLFLFSSYLNFCPDFLVMLKNDLIRKIWLISKCIMSQPD